MIKKNIAELLVETLKQAGVKNIYGVSGDSLNGITDTIRSRKDLQWVHVLHEETAAFAAFLTMDAQAGIVNNDGTVR
jgi:pyruvate dehydrogenase (quinone)